MVKFIKAPKIPKYEGELEEVSYHFLVPTQKHPRTGLTGFRAISWPMRKIVAGLGEKPMAFWGCKFLGCKKKKVVRSKLPNSSKYVELPSK